MMMKKLEKILCFSLVVAALQTHAVIVRYGQVGYSDTGNGRVVGDTDAGGADIDISFTDILFFLKFGTPNRIRTCNSRLEISGYIPLTIGAKI